MMIRKEFGVVVGRYTGRGLWVRGGRGLGTTRIYKVNQIYVIIASNVFKRLQCTTNRGEVTQEWWIHSGTNISASVCVCVCRGESFYYVYSEWERSCIGKTDVCSGEIYCLCAVEKRT